eukprot:5754636-Prymnesium_polylepis.1
MRHSDSICHWDPICCHGYKLTAPAPAEWCWSAPLTRPLAGKILRRKPHERQQGGMAWASKPNACSSRALAPACLLAVSEGRTLRTGRLVSHRWDARAWAGSSLHTCEVLFGSPPVSDRAISTRTYKCNMITLL